VTDRGLLSVRGQEKRRGRLGVIRTAIAGTLVALAIGVAADEASAAAKKPDATIRVQGGDLVGDDVYAEDGGQGADVEPPGPATFIVRVGNDGTEVDSFRVFGVGVQTLTPDSKAAIDTGGVKISFKLQGNDVTEKVAAGRLKFRNIPPGASSPKLKMIVEAEEGYEGGGVVLASSLDNPNREDIVLGSIRETAPF
jgi:hypothetical protein